MKMSESRNTEKREHTLVSHHQVCQTLKENKSTVSKQHKCTTFVWWIRLIQDRGWKDKTENWTEKYL